MAIVTMNSLSEELTPQEIKELEELENRPIVFDEDCPEMTEDLAINDIDMVKKCM